MTIGHKLPRRLVRLALDRIQVLVPRGSDLSGQSGPDDPGSRHVYILTDPSEQAKPRSLVSYLGEMEPNVAEVIGSAAFACRAGGQYPVVVVSELRPDLIAAGEFPIEFIPSLRHLHISNDEYERYVRRRWSLMLMKWAFATQIALRLDFEAFLARQIELGKQ